MIHNFVTRPGVDSVWVHRWKESPKKYDAKAIVDWLFQNNFESLAKKIRVSVMTQTVTLMVLQMHTDFIKSKKKINYRSSTMRLYFLMCNQIAKFKIMMANAQEEELFFTRLNYIYKAEEAIDLIDENMSHYGNCLESIGW